MNELRSDIVIIGGGTGGVAAAMAAASAGRKVVLTEETDWLGGQLTSQAVPPDEHLYVEKFGCTRRYADFRTGVRSFYRQNYPLTAAARREPYLNPGGGYVSPLCFEPHVGKMVIDQMLAYDRARGNLRVLLNRKPVAAEVDGDVVKAVVVEDTLTGDREVLTAPYFLDATELGDVLPLSGVEYVSGAESQAETGEPHAVEGAPQPENVQAITWCFPMGWDNAPGADHTIEKPEQYERWYNYVPDTCPAWGGKLLSWKMMNAMTGKMVDRALFLMPGQPKEWFRGLWGYRKIVTADHYAETDRPNEVTLVNWPQNDYFVRNPIDKSEVEQVEIFEEARQLSLSLLYWIQTEAPRHDDSGTGYPQMYLVPELVGRDDGMAKYPYIRESRRIKAQFTVLEQHVSRDVRKKGPAERFADSVGIGHYNIDLHPSVTGVHDIGAATWPFQIPLGSLIPIRVKNLLPACKNIGVTHITNGCYRLHPIEWNIGESAGSLAAFCLLKDVSPEAVREDQRLLAEFQKMLVGQGIEIDWPMNL